jgi:hypothetical protein
MLLLYLESLHAVIYTHSNIETQSHKSLNGYGMTHIDI